MMSLLTQLHAHLGYITVSGGGGGEGHQSHMPGSVVNEYSHMTEPIPHVHCTCGYLWTRTMLGIKSH